MGCTTSKLDDLPAVELCHQRCVFLDEAIHQRYALSAAHLSYINSLQSIAVSLRHFTQFVFTSSPSPTSPLSQDDGHHQLPSPLQYSYPPPFTYIDHSYAPKGPADADAYMHMNYMRYNPTPPQVYEQRPVSPHAAYLGEYSSSSLYPSSHPNTNSCIFPHYGVQTFGGGSSGYYGSPPPYGLGASSSQPPPRFCSPWDFVSFYDNGDNYYSQYTPSRNSKEIREEEGIPDLEDDDEYEVVKQKHGIQRDKDDGAGNHSESTEDNHAKLTEALLNQTTPIVFMDNNEVHENDEWCDSPRDAFEAASMIEVQFRRASEFGTEIARILEVGTLPYYRKRGAYQAFSKLLNLVALPLSMVSKRSTCIINKAGPSSSDLDGDLLTRSRNLSSTLLKLHLWEKKLYKEVKAEEKMRDMHDRKCRKLKRLDDRGADFHKVDSTRTLINTLSIKIGMAIKVVDMISMKINKIRDEELWPQLNELIQGLTRMWKSMLECHRSQCEAIREARILGWMGSRKKSGDALETTKQLEQELINWTLQFSKWVRAQKGYVRALNNWLLKCLMYEPQETPDGRVALSPSRMGAPPIFVICNRWSQAMESVSEKEVLDSMHVLAMRVLQIWEQDRLEMHFHVERNGEGDVQKLEKQIQAIERKMVVAFGQVNNYSLLSDSQDVESTSLLAGLQRIFESMERFTHISATLHQELLQPSEVGTATCMKEFCRMDMGDT